MGKHFHDESGEGEHSVELRKRQHDLLCCVFPRLDLI